MQSVQQRANRALAQALAARIGKDALDGQGYVHNLDDNLLQALSPRIRSELAAGDGGELIGDRPKIQAAHSSAALAINAFGRWLGHEDALFVAGIRGFDELHFECKCPIGIPGNPPNLDVMLIRKDAVVAVESKCTEYLRPPKPSFRPPYARAIEKASPSWRTVYELLTRTPSVYSHFNAAQIVKHYLGLKNTFPAEQVTLVYLFWEPTNWEDEPAFCLHRREVDEFASTVADERVRFVAQSYNELLATWSTQIEPPWIAAHVGALRQRYRVSLSPREHAIAELYRIAYGEEPDDPRVGETGAMLAAELIERD